MADTVRTRTELLAALADNTIGNISPQDMRDAIVSLFGIYGSVKAVNNAVVQALVAATAAKMTNFTKDGLAVATTPDFTNNQIALPNGGTYVIFAQVSLKSSVASLGVKVNLAIDDVAGDGGFEFELPVAGESASGSCVDILTVVAAEVLSLRVEADANNNLTLIDGQLIAIRIG